MADPFENRLDELITAARAAGADAAEAQAVRSDGTSVSVRHGKLETVQRAESEFWFLRLWVGARSASQISIDLRGPSERNILIERTLLMARSAPEDPYSGLAPAALIGATDDAALARLELYDPAEVDAGVLEDWARAAEAAALEISGVTNSEGGSASAGAFQSCHVTSEGFVGRRRASSFGLSVTVIAGAAGAMEIDGYSRTTRWKADMPTPQAIGREAALRTVARVGARKCRSTRAPVIFERRIAMQLLMPFLAATSGQAIARGASFLRTRSGERVFAPRIRIVDDPTVVRGLGSDFVDGEGLPSRYAVLVDDGVLTGWRLDLASARQLRLTPNGYAGRTHYNLTLMPGQASLATLMTDAGDGLLITGMFGPSLNIQTGDWSAGVNGIWFEKGEPAHPVNETTVAGSLSDIYARLVPGSDLLIEGPANSPSLLVDGVTIAGL